MDKQVFILAHPQARRKAMQAVAEAESGMRVEIKPRTRSTDQNALLHSYFSEVAKQSTWHGRKMTAVQWKTLFISGHSIATGLGSEMIPGLENEFVNIRESSAAMSVTRMSSLIEYVQAWCAENNVKTFDAVPA
jgi:hypothetical protein